MQSGFYQSPRNETPQLKTGILWTQRSFIYKPHLFWRLSILILLLLLGGCAGGHRWHTMSLTRGPVKALDIPNTVVNSKYKYTPAKALLFLDHNGEEVFRISWDRTYQPVIRKFWRSASKHEAIYQLNAVSGVWKYHYDPHAGVMAQLDSDSLRYLLVMGSHKLPKEESIRIVKSLNLRREKNMGRE